MATRQASFYCPQCQTQRLFTSTSGINHVLHLLITLFMCGLWAPIWILIAMGDNPAYHCAQCGFSDGVKYLNNPNLRQSESILAQRKQAKREKNKEEAVDWVKSSRAYLWAADSQNTWKVAVGTFAGVIIGAILIFSFVDFAASSQSVPPIANKSNLSDSQNTYIREAILYLDNDLREDTKLAEVMNGANSGKSNLSDIKKQLEIARTSEYTAYLKYKNVLVPILFSDTNQKIARTQELHDEAFNEFLKYWKDNKISHINSGTEKFKSAVNFAGSTSRETKMLLENK